MSFAMNPPASRTWPCTSDERSHAVWMHVSLLTAAMGGVVITLILWLAKRDRSAFIDDHGREALNAQISFLIYFTMGTILTLIGIGPLLLGALAIGTLVTLIQGAKAAKRGELYRYPMCLRFLR
jgi:hypothetical protein